MRSEFRIQNIIGELEQKNLLPAIVFRTSRNQCDLDVEALLHSGELLSRGAQVEIRKLIREVAHKYEMNEELITGHPHFEALTLAGIGAHHAGQLLVWRLLLEELMSAGILRVLVATGTVAAGVDFPARTVVITAHSKRGAEGFAALSSAEFQQMSGRAGRRGRDAVGFCLTAPAPFCDARTVLKISKRPPEPLRSAYFSGPSTVLNLLRYRNVDDLRFTVGLSLAAFKDKKDAALIRSDANEILKSLPVDREQKIRLLLDEKNRGESEEEEENRHALSKVEKKIFKNIRRHYRMASEKEQNQQLLLDRTINGLGKLGYVDGLSLSPKGYWAANLCTTMVLELAECIVEGVFEKISMEKLVSVVAALSADEHRQYLEIKKSPLTKEEIVKLQEILSKIVALKLPGVLEHRNVVPSAATTVLTWMNCESWTNFRTFLQFDGVAEGDAARIITQTAEQLNQLVRLNESHPELSVLAAQAVSRLLRPPLTEEVAFPI
jgi:ATP-dependent RNA helicase HelY